MRPLVALDRSGDLALIAALPRGAAKRCAGAVPRTSTAAQGRQARAAGAGPSHWKVTEMAAFGASSGAPLVDRRFEMAEGFAAHGDLAAAREILGEAMGLAPDWAAGWFRLGEWHAAAGDLVAAAAAWEAALRADPEDVLGAGLKRDLARRVPVVESMPPAFVETLFDQYAGHFDAALVDKLGYRAPELLRAALAGRRFGRAMDLGCGTGLAGAALRDRVDWLEGCDISGQMLAQAGAKGIYDRLEKRDLAALEIGARYDLVIAADVFTYLGALERILGWVAASLEPDGCLAFTVEAAGEGEPPLSLRESRRFAHSRAYLDEVLAAAGFARRDYDTAVLRHDRGAPIWGFIVVAGALVRQGDREGDGEAAALV